MNLEKIRKIASILFVVLAVILFNSCSGNHVQDRKIIIASNYPVAFILKELVAVPRNVVCITSPGTSEHTFSPKPSDIQKSVNASAIFYISENLDRWITKISHNRKISLLNFVAKDSLIDYEHHHNSDGHEHDIAGTDPHFWTDPLLIREVVPFLARELISIYPEDSANINNRAELLTDKLNALDAEIASMLDGYSGRYVLLFHPSFLYFIQRYNLQYAGSVEEFPGKEPSIQYIADINDRIRKFGLRAVYREPQLPEKSLMPITNGSDLKILMLDPIGGIDGRNNYFDLMRFNALSIKKGFE